MERLALLLLLALGATASCSEPDAGELAGDYRRSHRVFVFHGSEPVEVEAEDRLVLDKSTEGGLGFSLSVTAAGGQTCRVDGIAGPKGGGFEFRPREVPGCVLHFVRRDREILIEDVDDGCRAAYCGERASLGRLVFAVDP